MDNAGTNVTLTVSSRNLSLVSIESGDVIAKHEMPQISFASGGDTVSIATVNSGNQFGYYFFLLNSKNYRTHLILLHMLRKMC